MVTGASSGIGRGTSIACANMGATVFLNGRNVDSLEATLKQMQGENHVIVDGDITKQESVENIVALLPQLDGIVHCAGIMIRKVCKQIERVEIEGIMNTNFNAPVLLLSSLLQQKKINKGASIVFIASVAPFVPTVGNALYSASKGAIMAYSNCLSMELAPRKIRVNCICPGMIRTDLLVKADFTEEEIAQDIEKYPLKRYGTPDDVANAVVFFLSDASSWITGTNLKIAGGITY